MQSLKEQFAAKKAARPDATEGNRKSRRTVKHAAKHQQNRTPFIALMLMQNEKLQAMLLEASQSTYVPVPRGDHRPWSGLVQIRKAAARNAAWNGARG